LSRHKTAGWPVVPITNIWNSGESIQVKEEEIDWLIYHQINSEEGSGIPELAKENNLPENVVEAALRRLEGNLLIEIRMKRAYLLSINESLIRCQTKYDQTLPYTIENGVIKAKKR
jgi:hypothetical protein